jgi:O-antigen/teichoic acid export membrane protein
MRSVRFKEIAYAFSPAAFCQFLKRIEDSDLKSRLARGVFWSIAGSIISRSLTLCSTIIVARILGKAVYGELGMIQSTIGMFGVFAGFSLGLTATKHVAELRQIDPERVGRIIGITNLFSAVSGGLMAICLFMSASWLSETTINAPHLDGTLRIGSLVLFISALNGAQTGTLSGFEAFRTIARINLVVGLFSFPLLVAGAYLGNLKGAVWALVINLAFNWFFNYLALRRECKLFNIPLSCRGFSNEFPVLWRFSLPAALSSIMVAPANWVSRVLLTNHPNGYNEIASFTAAFTFQHLLLSVSVMLSAPLLSMISNNRSNNDTFLEKFNILSSWMIGVFSGIFLLCFPELVQLAFGSEYSGHSFRVTFSLIIFTTSIITFKAGLARVLAANDLLWWGFFSNLFWATILILSSIKLVQWGAIGIAVSFLIAYTINTLSLLPLYYSRNLVPFDTLISKESFIIWSVLIFLLIVNIFQISLFFRCLFLFPSLFIVTISFKRISIKNN